jgi:hypothetical protein
LLERIDDGFAALMGEVGRADSARERPLNRSSWSLGSTSPTSLPGKRWSSHASRVAPAPEKERE